MRHELRSSPVCPTEYVPTQTRAIYCRASITSENCPIYFAEGAECDTDNDECGIDLECDTERKICLIELDRESKDEMKCSRASF